MVYAEVPVSVFGHVQVTLEAVSMHDGALPYIARNEACQTLAARALYPFDSHPTPAPFNGSGERNFPRKSAPASRNLAPALASGSVALVDFYDVTFRPDFFFAPQSFRRRFFRGAFGKTRVPSCG